MPVRKVSLREEAYRLLQSLQSRYGATSLSDTVLLLAEKAQHCEKLEERLQAIEKRLEELEATARKTYLALLKLLEEPTGRTSGEGPESPAGGAVKEGREDERTPSRTVTRPLDADRPAPEPLRRGREPQKDIQQATGE